MRRLMIGLLLVFVTISASAEPVAVVGGTAISPGEKMVLPESVILVDGGRIVRVGRIGEVAVPKEAKVVDARGKWIIPGLIDAHVHFHQSGGLYTRPDALDLRKIVPYEKERSTIRANLDDTFARYLRCGVTSVVDVGGPFWNFEVRERAGKSLLAPRVAVAGPLISTIRPPVLGGPPDPAIIRAETPRQARELVRRQAAQKPDLIKVWYIVRPGERVEKFLPIMNAVVTESRRRKLRVAVHATELETARAAVNAGADILVHSVADREVDDDFLRLLKRRQTVYVTTLGVKGGYAKSYRQQHDFTPADFAVANPYIMGSLFDLRHITIADLPPGTQSMLRDPIPVSPPTFAMANLKKVHDAGITVAAGTDAGNIGTLPGPSIYHELQMMVDSGLAPMEVLSAATAGGAKVMGREKELGALEEGMLADMVVLNADPLSNIGNLSDIHLVIKGGIPLRPEEIVRKRPADVVQQQVNAYNAANLEALSATYAPDAPLFRFPDTPLVSGRDSLRKEFSKELSLPNRPHRKVVNRIVRGNFVVDLWETLSVPAEKPKRGATVYEVRDGLIRRVWELPD